MITKRNDMVEFNVRDLVKWKAVYIDSWLPGSSGGEMASLRGRQAVIFI